MKGVNYLRVLFMLMLIFSYYSCEDNGAGYEQEIKVPGGVYIVGSGTKFSVEAIKGKMNVLKEDTLFYLNTWLQDKGEIRILLVEEDGIPTYYGEGERLQQGDTEHTSYSMAESGTAFTVPEEGLYLVIVNPILHEVHFIAYNFKMVGNMIMTEEGSREVAFNEVSYDNINHIVTWKTGNESRLILATEYRLMYGNTNHIEINGGADKKFVINTGFTGPERNSKTNLLSPEYTTLTKDSDVNLKLPRKGNYIVTIRYDVLKNQFFAKIEGEEIIEPEPQGYSETLYMAGDDFGGLHWDSDNVVEMIPVGVKGNGSFWGIKYFTAGNKVKWSTEKSSVGSFASLGNEINYVVESDYATVTESGLYLVYVDLHRKLVAFETPNVYGMGECFDGDEVTFDLTNNIFEAKTTTTGNLRMYAASNYNDRDWNSMEFNIYNGEIVYRGIDTDNQELVPVASNIQLKLDFHQDKGVIDVPLNKNTVPSSATALYLIGDEFGNMNWGSPDVKQFQRSFSEDYRWFYINYFEAGTGLRFSTSKIFGSNGEFVSLDNNGGFTVQDGKAIIPSSGIYIVYVDLSTRSVYIQRATFYAYDAATGWTNLKFEESQDGKTVFVTLPQSGRLRINPEIPAFTGLNPSFSSWKREVALNPETLNIFYRQPGAPEPNNTYVWTAGSKITLDFRQEKGKIELP